MSKDLIALSRYRMQAQGPSMSDVLMKVYPPKKRKRKKAANKK